MPGLIDTYRSEIERIEPDALYGRVTAVMGMLVEVGGIDNHLAVGARITVEAQGGRKVPCEVVGFRDGRGLLMPFTSLDGIGLGCRAVVAQAQAVVWPGHGWLGRVVNALGEPVDGKGPLIDGELPIPLRNTPPPPHQRNRMGDKIDLGVRPINTFLSLCRGQRMGIFAGSGVGKSTLMGMLARDATADINVIGLLGERGREVQEFIEDILGPEGLARSVVVVATSDESPLMRRQAAYMTLSVSEYFRDNGLDVLCMMDSVTRFAMAQREIGLSAGEPPTSKGYPPTTFSELARLLERAGPGAGEQSGSITALLSVLVDGDDHNEPIADATRGIIDGHIVLDRAIAERGRYPAINILKSVSRAMPGCNTEDQTTLVTEARSYLSAYEDMAELIRLGAYKKGSDPKVDKAIHLYPQLEAFLKQGQGEVTGLQEGYDRLAQILQSAGANQPGSG
ncbi:MAG: flagellar protein export ATPase FliI [Alphaproteobacteria bacterium]